MKVTRERIYKAFQEKNSIQRYLTRRYLFPMLEHLGWSEAAELIVKGMMGAISARTVTYDFERLIRAEGGQVTLLKCSEFADAIIKCM